MSQSSSTTRAIEGVGVPDRDGFTKLGVLLQDNSPQVNSRNIEDRVPHAAGGLFWLKGHPDPLRLEHRQFRSLVGHDRSSSIGAR
jgi:hypothetical protein